ncbi:Mur ligase [Chytriomyces sp. MP71]|nr:Mur ligase [Chytriomyces sp. MP71]
MAAKIELGLDRIHALLLALGNPQSEIGATIHVAGTNGKGSTCALLSHALSYQDNLNVGRFSSPHLVDPTDAITVNNVPIPQSDYDRLSASIQSSGVEASSFEAETALAFLYFKELKTDVCVIEVGLGGRLDATNVLPNSLCVITSLSLDHTEFLGDTIEKIAFEKAGIIQKSSKAVILGPQSFPTASQIVQERASTLNVSLHFPDPVTLSPPRQDDDPTSFQRVLAPLHHTQHEIKLPLLGAHQLENLSIVLTVLTHLPTHFPALPLPPATQLIAGLEQTRWPGRLELITLSSLPHRHILADGAHNPAGAASLRAFLKTYEARIHYIFGCKQGVTDARTRELVAGLFGPGDRVWVVGFEAPVGMPWVRASPGDDIARVLLDVFPAGGGELGEVRVLEGGVTEAFELLQNEESSNDLVVVCGSLYLVASLHRYIRSL